VWNEPRGKIRLLMTPGPVEVSPRVLEAMARPQIYHYYRNFVDFFAETTEKVRKIFQTNNDILILQGEGVLGLEAAVVNCVNAGDKVLVLDSGPFGKGFREYVLNAEGRVSELTVDYHRAIDKESLKQKLDADKDIKAMTVVHCETPTGVLNPVQELCPLAKERGIVTIVDAVASLGGVDLKPDQWDIDVCVSASQKAISSSAGLTLMSISPEAWETIDKKKKPIRNSYLSLIDWRDSWIKNRRFPFTPSIGDMYGLGEACDILLEEGLQNSFSRHATVAEECRTGIETIGMQLWAERKEICSNTVTTIDIPEGYSDAQIVNTMVEKYGILIGGGFRETKGQLLRIGHMGYQATTTNIVATIEAMRRTLTELQPTKRMIAQ